MFGRKKKDKTKKNTSSYVEIPDNKGKEQTKKKEEENKNKLQDEKQQALLREKEKISANQRRAKQFEDAGKWIKSLKTLSKKLEKEPLSKLEGLVKAAESFNVGYLSLIKEFSAVIATIPKENPQLQKQFNERKEALDKAYAEFSEQLQKSKEILNNRPSLQQQQASQTSLKNQSVDLPNEEEEEDEEKKENLVDLPKDEIKEKKQEEPARKSMVKMSDTTQKTNLRLYPTKIIKDSNPNAQFTIGDLHGNPIKLLHFLIEHGVVEMEPKQYQRLIEIYESENDRLKWNALEGDEKTKRIEELKKDINEFNSIISQIKIKEEPLPFIRLIGDVLADRGNNDYFTLKVIEQLGKKNVPMSILYSNHDADFIEACENPELYFSPPRLLLQDHGASLKALHFLFKEGIVTRDEIEAIAKPFYQPTLKLLDYTLSEDKKEITLYSHAGIDLALIKALAGYKLEDKEKGINIDFNIPYDDSSPEKLAETINKINAKFQEYVVNGTVSKLYTEESMNNGYGSTLTLEDKIKNPIAFLVWNRDYDILTREPQHPDHGYFINYVHGHDTPSEEFENVYAIDNMFAKVWQDKYLTGYNPILTAYGDSVRPEYKPQAVKQAQVQTPPKEEKEEELMQRQQLENDKEQYKTGINRIEPVFNAFYEKNKDEINKNEALKEKAHAIGILIKKIKFDLNLDLQEMDNEEAKEVITRIKENWTQLTNQLKTLQNIFNQAQQYQQEEALKEEIQTVQVGGAKIRLVGEGEFMLGGSGEILRNDPETDETLPIKSHPFYDQNDLDPKVIYQFDTTDGTLTDQNGNLIAATPGDLEEEINKMPEEEDEDLENAINKLVEEKTYSLNEERGTVEDQYENVIWKYDLEDIKKLADSNFELDPEDGRIISFKNKGDKVGEYLTPLDSSPGWNQQKSKIPELKQDQPSKEEYVENLKLSVAKMKEESLNKYREARINYDNFVSKYNEAIKVNKDSSYLLHSQVRVPFQQAGIENRLKQHYDVLHLELPDNISGEKRLENQLKKIETLDTQLRLLNDEIKMYDQSLEELITPSPQKPDKKIVLDEQATKAEEMLGLAQSTLDDYQQARQDTNNEIIRLFQDNQGLKEFQILTETSAKISNEINLQYTALEHLPPNPAEQIAAIEKINEKIAKIGETLSAYIEDAEEKLKSLNMLSETEEDEEEEITIDDLEEKHRVLSEEIENRLENLKIIPIENTVCKQFSNQLEEMSKNLASQQEVIREANELDIAAEVGDLETNIKTINNTLTDIEKQLRSYDEKLSNVEISKEALRKLIDTYWDQLLAKTRQLVDLYKNPSHPTYKTLYKQLDAIEKEVKDLYQTTLPAINENDQEGLRAIYNKLSDVDNALEDYGQSLENALNDLAIKSEEPANKKEGRYVGGEALNPRYSGGELVETEEEQQLQQRAIRLMQRFDALYDAVAIGRTRLATLAITETNRNQIASRQQQLVQLQFDITIAQDTLNRGPLDNILLNNSERVYGELDNRIIAYNQALGVILPEAIQREENDIPPPPPEAENQDANFQQRKVYLTQKLDELENAFDEEQQRLDTLVGIDVNEIALRRNQLEGWQQDVTTQQQLLLDENVNAATLDTIGTACGRLENHLAQYEQALQDVLQEAIREEDDEIPPPPPEEDEAREREVIALIATIEQHLQILERKNLDLNSKFPPDDAAQKISEADYLSLHRQLNEMSTLLQTLKTNLNTHRENPEYTLNNARDILNTNIPQRLREYDTALQQAISAKEHLETPELEKKYRKHISKELVKSYFSRIEYFLALTESAASGHDFDKKKFDSMRIQIEAAIRHEAHANPDQRSIKDQLMAYQRYLLEHDTENEKIDQITAHLEMIEKIHANIEKIDRLNRNRVAYFGDEPITNKDDFAAAKTHVITVFFAEAENEENEEVGYFEAEVNREVNRRDKQYTLPETNTKPIIHTLKQDIVLNGVAGQARSAAIHEYNPATGILKSHLYLSEETKVIFSALEKQGPVFNKIAHDAILQWSLTNVENFIADSRVTPPIKLRTAGLPLICIETVMLVCKARNIACIPPAGLSMSDISDKQVAFFKERVEKSDTLRNVKAKELFIDKKEEEEQKEKTAPSEGKWFKSPFRFGY